MEESTFKARLLSDFGLTYATIKSKHAYDMVKFMDDAGTEGTVFGHFAGHSHMQAVCGFEYRGWVYALPKSGSWVLCRDGMGGWRKGDNPFPTIPEDIQLTTW